MFHFTTQTHGHTMVLVGGYKECILLQDVFRKNDETSFLKRRSMSGILTSFVVEPACSTVTRPQSEV